MNKFDCGDVSLTTEETKHNGLRLVFIHMDFSTINKQFLKDIKQASEELRRHYDREGVASVFALTDNKKIVRLWKRVKEPFRVDELGDGSYLVSWLTED